MLHLKFWLLVATIVSTVSAFAIDNELSGEPTVQCEENLVSLTFHTKKPFTGRVYVQGLADDPRCAQNFAKNVDQSTVSMKIQSGDCTMARERVSGNLEGMMVSMTVVVSFHGTFVTKADRAYRCMCFFKSVKRITNGLEVNAAPTTEILDTAATPECEYSIRSGSPDGPPVHLGHVGQQIYHVFVCNDPTHSFLVHSCSVDDGRGVRFDLLDLDGCAIDPVIQPDAVYDRDGTRASIETFGYKFSDSIVLNYQCTIEICKKNTGECRGLTPPSCGRVRRASSSSIVGQEAIRRRARSEMPADQIEVSKSLSMTGVDDSPIGDNESLDPSKNAAKAVEELSASNVDSYEIDSAQRAPADCFTLASVVVGVALVLASVAFVGVLFMSMRRRSIEYSLKSGLAM